MADPQPTPPRTAEPPRRIRRSRRDRMIGGVCGGLAGALGVDPLLLRIAAVALALSGGLGVLAYIVAWIVIPEAGENEPERATPVSGRHAATLTVGAGLIAAGVLLLMRSWWPWLGAGVFWPLVVVAVGVAVLASARSGPRSP